MSTSLIVLIEGDLGQGWIIIGLLIASGLVRHVTALMVLFELSKFSIWKSFALRTIIALRCLNMSRSALPFVLVRISLSQVSLLFNVVEWVESVILRCRASHMCLICSELLRNLSAPFFLPLVACNFHFQKFKI